MHLFTSGKEAAEAALARSQQAASDMQMRFQTAAPEAMVDVARDRIKVRSAQGTMFSDLSWIQVGFPHMYHVLGSALIIIIIYFFCC